MNKERLASGLVATIVGLLVAFVLVPGPIPEVPAGDYVLIEGTLQGVTVEPGLALTSDGEVVRGQGGCNTFTRNGFMTTAGCIPEPVHNEVLLAQTVNDVPDVTGDRLVFESEFGRLVYERR